MFKWLATHLRVEKSEAFPEKTVSDLPPSSSTRASVVVAVSSNATPLLQARYASLSDFAILVEVGVPEDRGAVADGWVLPGAG